jgi:hypothetical protein
MPVEETSSTSADPPGPVIDLRRWLAESFERDALPSHVASFIHVSEK